MAKRAYLGIDGMARKIKRGYIGVNEAARKIKKAYIGVGGVARPCWSGGEVTYYGTITPLSAAREISTAVTVGGYALFPAGTTMNAVGSPTWATVDTYDRNLTKGLAPDVSNARGNYAAASVGNHALIVGGYSKGSTFNTVDIYDESLTHTTTTISSAASGNRGCCSTQNHAFFLFGKSSSYQSYAYDENLTRTSITSHNCQYNEGGMAVAGDYAIYTEGSVAYAYGNTLTRKAVTALSVSRQYVSLGAATKNHALFAGGASEWGAESVATVDTYDADLTKGTADDLSSARSWHGGVNLFGNALLVGGSDSEITAFYGQVDVYDEELVHKTLTSITPTGNFSGTVVGDFAIFAGGRTGPEEFADETAAAHAFTLD